MSKVIIRILERAARLCAAPVIGAFQGTHAAWNQPPAKSWKAFILLDVRRYVAPLTGAIAGVKNAWKQGEQGENRER